MKKLVIAVLACAGLMASAQGQDTVSSANIVGYMKDISQPDTYHIASLQFEVPSNTVPEVYGETMPQGTVIYKFNKALGRYDTASYLRGFDVPTLSFVVKWNEDLELVNGEGFWVQAPPGEAITNLFSGVVPSADAITNVLGTGFSLVSYPYPVDRVVTNLGIVPVQGDTLYVFNLANGTYDTASYFRGFDVPTLSFVVKWNEPDLVIKAGTGFWYQTTNENTWVATKPF